MPSFIARSGIASVLVLGTLVATAPAGNAVVSIFDGSIVAPDQAAGWFLRPSGQDTFAPHEFFIAGTDSSGPQIDPAIALHYGLNHFTIMGAGNPPPQAQVTFSVVLAPDYSKYIVLPYQDVGDTSGSVSLPLDGGDVVTVSNFIFNYATEESPTTYGLYGPGDGTPNFIASVDITIPEPYGLGLFGSAIGMLGLARRNRRA